MSLKKTIPLIFLVISQCFSVEVYGGASAVGGRKICFNCWEAGFLTRLSSNSITPQFTLRYGALEGYIGASLSGTDDTLWASAEKYKLSTADTLYLAEVDSYSLGLETYFLQPEIGIRIFFFPRKPTTLYLNLGTFWVIPILKESYQEKFYHYNDSGRVVRAFENTSSGGPKVSTSGVYEIGLHSGLGAQYRVNKNFSVFGEFAVRVLLGGADISYNYYHDLVEPGLEELEKQLWLGGGRLSAFTATGYLGVQFYW